MHTSGIVGALVVIHCFAGRATDVVADSSAFFRAKYSCAQDSLSVRVGPGLHHTLKGDQVSWLAFRDQELLLVIGFVEAVHGEGRASAPACLMRFKKVFGIALNALTTLWLYFAQYDAILDESSSWWCW